MTCGIRSRRSLGRARTNTRKSALVTGVSSRRKRATLTWVSARLVGNSGRYTPGPTTTGPAVAAAGTSTANRTIAARITASVPAAHRGDLGRRHRIELVAPCAAHVGQHHRDLRVV